LDDLTLSYREVDSTFIFETATANYQALVDRLLSGETVYFISNHLPADSPLWAAPIGQDGVAIIVHPTNNISGLSTEQLRRIYQGQIRNWRDVGGDNQPITVISREDGSGTRAIFERLVMGERQTTRAARLAPSSLAMIGSVAQTPAGIGYVSMSYVDTSVRTIAIDQTVATQDTVLSNSYPLRSTIFVIGQEEPESAYRLFIGWIQSPEGQATVSNRFAPFLPTP
jgi:phosphate transport system substrate-binding protein